MMSMPGVAAHADVPALKATLQSLMVDSEFNAACTVVVSSFQLRTPVVWPPNSSLNVPATAMHVSVCTSSTSAISVSSLVMSAASPNSCQPVKVTIMPTPGLSAHADVPALNVTVAALIDDIATSFVCTAAALSFQLIGALVWPPNDTVKVPVVALHVSVCTSRTSAIFVTSRVISA